MATLLALPLLNWLPAHPIAQRAAAVTSVSTYEVEMPALPLWPIALALGAYALWTSWSLVSIGRALLQLGAAKRRCREMPLGRQNRLPRWCALRSTGKWPRRPATTPPDAPAPARTALSPPR